MKTLWTTVTVEAESEDAAIEKAFDANPTPGQLCAYCSGYSREWSVDEDEWDVPPKDFKENPVTLVS